jgi:CheY-like chemotaxis protein
VRYSCRCVFVVQLLTDCFFLLQETGGGLNDQIFSSYSNLNLTTAPIMDRAATMEEALEMMTHQKFDLIILMLRIGGGSSFQFINEANNLAPSIPVLILVPPPPPQY